MSDDSDSDSLPDLEPHDPWPGAQTGAEATMALMAPNALLDDEFARSQLSLSRSQALALRATLSAFDIGVARKLSTIEFSELLAAHGVVPAHARPGFWRYVSAAFVTLDLFNSASSRFAGKLERHEALLEVAPALAVLLAAPTESVAATVAATLVHSEPAATLMNGELPPSTASCRR